MEMNLIVIMIVVVLLTLIVIVEKISVLVVIQTMNVLRIVQIQKRNVQVQFPIGMVQIVGMQRPI